MTAQDSQYLSILSIAHYVLGVLMALCGCFPILHFALGSVMLVAPESLASSGEPPPPALAALIGGFFVLIAGALMLTAWVVAGCAIATGRFLAQRRNYVFCLIVAGLECMFMPFGTVVGVFTLVVLLREPVRRAFGQPVGEMAE